MPKIDLESLVIENGAHSSPDKGMCVMEAVAWVAGEPHSDHPVCACPILSTFLRSWNDSLNDQDRQMLKPYIPRIVGTNDGNSDRRGWMFLDWLSRECAVAFLEAANLGENAAALRSLAEIADKASLKAAQPVLQAAAKAADAAGDAAWAAAWDAAGDAAWDAAGDAARAAAGDAAGDAAWDAAGDAAGDAARAAAWDAAWDTAWDAARAAARDTAWAAARDTAWAAARDAARDAAGRKLAPVVASLQRSALALLDRMLSLPKPQVTA